MAKDRKEYFKQYYQENKEYFRKKARENYQKNRDERLMYQHRYYHSKRADREIMPWLIGFVEALLEDGEAEGRRGCRVERPYHCI